MGIRQLVLRLLGYRPKPHISFNADVELVHSLRELARQEQQDPEELIRDLLAHQLAGQNGETEEVRIWESLTAREKQVAALICLGNMGKEIAARLHVSPETVRTHKRNVFRKYDVKGQEALRRVLAHWDFSAWE